VITNPYDEEKEREIMYLTLNHITIKDDDNEELLVEEDVEKALPIFELENKPTMDELKEINLGTIENSRPTLLMQTCHLKKKGITWNFR
jgi:hypothetical protein